MIPHAGKAVLALLTISIGVGSAQVANLTGTWHLSVDKSRWGDVRKPVSTIVTVEHNEPQFQYSGTIVYAEGDDARTFAFSGAIDGKEYPISRSFGPGKIRMTRVNARTMGAVFKSDDGQWEENVRTTISRDGKIMERRIQRTGPSGEMQWTEVYERR